MVCMRNVTVQTIKTKYTSLESVLDERARRLWAATEARAIGWGGITHVAEATGLSRITIKTGLSELDLPVTPADRKVARQRLRRPGGGRKPLVDHDPNLLRDLETLVDPVTRGDPMSPLRWTCKSAAKLATELQARGHAVSERSVNRLLHDLDYSLQSNRKTIEGKGHPDRDAQFQYINRRVQAFQRQGQPVVSVDAKKKELVGQFRNGGREWQPQGQPEEVEVYDFAKRDLGKAIPYGYSGPRELDHRLSYTGGPEEGNQWRASGRSMGGPSKPKSPWPPTRATARSTSWPVTTASMRR
jgi:transposase